MKNSDAPVPRSDGKETLKETQLNDASVNESAEKAEHLDRSDVAQQTSAAQLTSAVDPSEKKVDKSAAAEKSAQHSDKKKKKRNLWPLKALVISLLLAFAVNALSSFSLTNAQLWVAIVITVVILVLGVLFDMIGTAATSCDIGPFLAMASRKVKGGKTAVSLAKKRDIVSSVCCDIVGDICGIVSGVCAATIAAEIAAEAALNSTAVFWVSVSVYAVISMATITLKAAGKGIAVKKANSIVFAVAKILSVFSKKG
ncbi:MAG: hypothetical protein NC132_04780 [Corallococcus sp.]|nr:hypothetical protein [Corallococcus sp.]MCM1359702.1 hypothetical protein [Corallococcus sp.]MCM1395411.1 hypothetical protein [Corallococcus sp.]